ncbi:hypothetical protein ScPMuIL_016286 [Solemya velum]
MTLNFAVFRKLGVKGPRPLPVLGNLHTFGKMGMIDAENLWRKKFGKVFGIFEGREPLLYICDLDMLKSVLVQDFNCFTDRREMDIAAAPMDQSVFMAKGEYWRHIRSHMTSSFSSAKLRGMADPIDKACRKLVNYLCTKAETREPVEMKDVFGAYTMNVICSTAFGLEIDSHEDPDNPFVRHAKDVVSIPLAHPAILAYLFLLFSVGVFRWLDYLPLSSKHMAFFSEITSDLIHERRKPGLTDDEIIASAVMFFLAGYEDAAAHLAFTTYAMATQPDIQRKLQVEIDNMPTWDRLDMDRVQCLPYLDMCMSESLRMYPTTTSVGVGDLRSASASVLRSVGRLRSVDVGDLPGVPVSVDCEVSVSVTYGVPMSVSYGVPVSVDCEVSVSVTYGVPVPVSYGVSVDCEVSMSVSYGVPVSVDCEVSVVDRVCTRDCDVGGIRIPRGLVISVPIYTVHHDPDIWDRPEEFTPERFSPGQTVYHQPQQFLPFGQGPRNCVGQRMGFLEAKMALIHVLKKFQFQTCGKTQIPLKFQNLPMLRAENGIWLQISRR